MQYGGICTDNQDNVFLAGERTTAPLGSMNMRAAPRRRSNYGGCLAYDDNGNLFVFGRPAYSETDYLGVLRRGHTKCKAVSVNVPLAKAAKMQWDRKYLAITEAHPRNDHPSHVVYRFRVSGTKAQLAHTVYFLQFAKATYS
jgi:hypothetical protein